jgi:hypothetical protein
MTTERFSPENMHKAPALMHKSRANAHPKPGFMHAKVMP